VSSYLHKESRVSSNEVLLDGFERLLVTVNFSPSVVGCIDAILRVHLIGSVMRHSIPLSVNGGSSELHMLNIRPTSQYCHSIHATADQSTVFTVANSGNQVAFVNALAFRDLASSSPLGGEVMKVDPSAFYIRPNQQQKVRVELRPAIVQSQ